MSSDYLDPILTRKREEIETLVEPKRLKEVLKKRHLTVIAEIKRKSPSKGDLAPIRDPVACAQKYLEGGAEALSILTDGPGFGGSLQDLREVSEAFPHIPILRKDFILDIKQLRETIRFGATAVLLIAAALKEKLPMMVRAAYDLGLEPLVEVHDEAELDLAIGAEAEIIGVNSRNLKTFHIDIGIAESLCPKIPSSSVKVAESGIRTAADAERMRRAGYDAVLVGEALVLSADPGQLIGEVHLCL